MEMTLVLTTLAAALAVTAFVLVHGVTRRWEESRAGRRLMAKGAAIGSVAWVAVLRRWDELTPSVDWSDALRPFAAFGWATVALVYVLHVRDSFKDDDAAS